MCKLLTINVLIVYLLGVDKIFLLFWLFCCVVPCVFLYLQCFDGLMLKLI